MKRLCKILIFTWMLFFCFNSPAAVHTYYFRMPVNSLLSSFTLTLYPGGTKVILQSGTSKDIELPYRIERVDREIVYYSGTSLVTEVYKDIIWEPYNLVLNCGSAPFYPLVYWDPHINITPENSNEVSLINKEIGSDEQIHMKVNRNGYTGAIPVYLSQSTSLPSTPRLLTEIPANSNHTFIPNNYWNSFETVFGTLDNILTKGFYMYAYWELKGQFGQSATVSTIPVGPVRLYDGLKPETSSEDITGICGQLLLEPSHLRPPYFVSLTQVINGTAIEKTFESNSFPAVVDFGKLNSLGLKALPTDIYIYKNSKAIRTKPVTKYFKGLKPDMTGMKLNLSDESCDGKNDGSVEVILPAMDPSFQLRLNIEGVTYPHIKQNHGTNLPAGIYNLILEYAGQDNQPQGCIIDVGNFEIERAPELRISIIENKLQTCSYINDAKLIVHTVNGIGDIDFRISADEMPAYVVEENTINITSGINYRVTAIDSKGCESTPMPAGSPPVEKLNIAITNPNISCYGDSIPVTLTGTGGTGLLQFKVGGKTIPNNGNAYFLGARHKSYTLELVDSNNCRETRDVSFEEPARLEFQSMAFTARDLMCHNDNSGKITLHGQGGTGKISGHLYDQLKIAYDDVNDTTFVGLSVQTYNAYLTDENGCLSDTITDITLSEPEGITFMNIKPRSETCNGTLDAGIELSLTGTADSLQWYRFPNQPLPGKTFQELTDVIPGTYELKAFYNNSHCEAKTAPISIANQPSIDFTTTYHESCSDGIGGGLITLTGISNSRLPLTIVIDGNEPQSFTGVPSIFSNLNSGVHTIEIRDSAYVMGGIYAEKCKASKSITINPKTKPVLTPAYNRPLCNGDNNGAILVTTLTGTDNPEVYAWLDSANDTIGSGNSLSNIPAGQYSAVIQDDYQCKSLQTGFILTEPARLIINNLSVENAACRDISDGRISISASGGTPPFQYSANGGLNWQTSPDLLNLASDEYLIRVRDQNQCIADTLITVSAFNPVIAVVKYDSVSCHNQANGSYTLTASGSKNHNLGYRYYRLGSSTPVSTGIFSNLDAGTYRFYALDKEGCYTDTITGIMYEPPPLNVDLTLRDSASCKQYTGKIGYTVLGGNGNYRLKWSNSVIGETTFLDTSALRTGNYTLTATDRKNCETSASVFVPDRPAPEITGITMTEQPWCGKPLGTAMVSVTSGSPGYKYRWSNPERDTLAIADGLTAGTYRITVTDRYNCSDEAEITLTDGPVINLNSRVVDPHCGQNDGRIELSVTGGVRPYLFHWPDSVSRFPLTDSSMTSLFAGIYPVKVTDAVGCEKVFPVSLRDLDGPTIDRVSVTKAWCGLPVGKAWVRVSNGASPYSYNWTISGSSAPLGNDSLITELKAGDYHVMVTDINNCKTSERVEITDSLELQPILTLVSLDSAACDKPVGKIRVTIGNGLEPYNYIWNTGSVNDSVVNIARGIYHVVSTDARGCKDSLAIEMPDRKAPVINFVSKESAYCGRPLGKAIVSASLGTMPYQTYLVDNPFKKYQLAYDPLTGKYLATIDRLLPSLSEYRIKVTDGNGCESPALSVIIDDDNPMTVSLLDVSPVSCHGGSDGRAIVKATEGFEPYTYEWSVNSVNSDTNAAIPAGPFNVTVTDSRLCMKTLYVTTNPITEPEPLTLGSSLITHPACHGTCDAQIEVVATGGNGGYYFVWNGADTAQTGTALCAGENILKIIDSKGCSYTGSFEIIDPEPLNGTRLPDEITMCSGQHYLADPGDEWTGVSWTSDNTFESDMNVAEIDRQGSYYMTGYSDKGCLVRDTIRVIISDDLLDAYFLMMSQANAGDTVVIIEVSWPVAEHYKWEFPEEANIIYDHENYKELVFEEAGTYYVELTASLAGCSSIKGKYIEILETGGENSDPIPGEDPSLIKSFTVYPNPASIEVNVEVKLAKSDDVRIEIISLSIGQHLRIINEYGFDTYRMPINIDQLAPGSYVIRLVAGDEYRTKILIVR